MTVHVLRVLRNSLRLSLLTMISLEMLYLMWARILILDLTVLYVQMSSKICYRVFPALYR